MQEFHHHLESCDPSSEGDFHKKKPDFHKFPYTPEGPKITFIPPPTYPSFDHQFGLPDKKFIPLPETNFGIPPGPPLTGFPHGPPSGFPYGPPPGFPRGPPPTFPHGPPSGFPFEHPFQPPHKPPPSLPKIPPYPPPKVPLYPNEPPAEPKQPNLPPVEPKQPTIPPETVPVKPSTGDNGVTNEPDVNVDTGTSGGVLPDQNGNSGVDRTGDTGTDSITEVSVADVTEATQENSNSEASFNTGLTNTNRQQPDTVNGSQVDRQLSETEVQEIINPRVGMNGKASSRTVKKTN